MIFKKPYAFLIKNFRLFHLILAIIMGYLVYQTNLLSSFFKEYLVNNKVITSLNITETYFNNLMFILPFVIIIFSIILLVVLIKKKKPFTFYIINIISSIITVAIYMYAYNICNTLMVQVIEARTMKLVSDLVFITLIFQGVSTLITVIRAIGFDIKKFNFVKDLQDLDVTATDSEEFEVNVELDTNKLRRKYNRTKRFSRYFYLEHKRVINIVVSIVLIAIASLSYYAITNQGKVYNEGETYSNGIYTMKINKSYITALDYKRNVVESGTTFVAIELDIKTKNKSLLNTAFFELLIDNKIYTHTITDQSKLFDLGNIYTNQEITSDYQKITLIYQIPASYLNKEMTLRYISNFGKGNIRTYYKTKLKPINLDIINEKYNFPSKEEYKINNGVLEGSSLNITSAKLSSRFVIAYRYCTSPKICYVAIDHIYPKLNTNYSKALLKVSGDITFRDGYKANYIYTLADLVKYYGKLMYYDNDNIKYLDLTYGEITNNHITTNDYYLEIPSDILDYENVSLILDIRGVMYEYKIK